MEAQLSLVQVEPEAVPHAQVLVPDFAAFYRDHRDSIAKALALTLRDPELAADATDEAMTRAVQRWSKVGTYANPQGWVYRVGLNWARSWLRRRKRERDRPISFGPATGALDVRDIALGDAIEGLSVDHRAVVICRYFLDWSVAQTADALKVPEGTVKSRLTRALDHLRTTLEEDEQR